MIGTQMAREPLTGILRPARRPWAAVSVTAVAVVAVPAFGWTIAAHPVDGGIVVVLNATHTGSWGWLADAVYWLFEPVRAVAVVVVVSTLVGVIARSPRRAIAFALVFAVTWAPVWLIKLLVSRPRPDAAGLAHPFLPAPSDWSFPSGHTAFVAAVVIACWFLARDTRWSVVVAGASVLAVGFMGVVVVTNGLHYPSDVLGSVVWTLATAPTVRWLVVDVGLGRFTAVRSTVAQKGRSPI